MYTKEKCTYLSCDQKVYNAEREQIAKSSERAQEKKKRKLTGEQETVGATASLIMGMPFNEHIYIANIMYMYTLCIVFNFKGM